MKELIIKFLLTNAIAKVVQVYSEWSTRDTVECNKIYPISFDVPNYPNTAKITAFDFQDLANYAQFSNKFKDNIYAGSAQFAAVLFWDN